ncbi:MAG TPA: RNA-binding protein [Microcoleaceae bacterium UBA10368]|jgi:Predicted RNA-binding protein|nr:RNA-binding protein [Microcoleaceae cyanobacterium UBA10368]HCV32250.1 RNA-binding protein [Microcoleaceae cyanobacterium UBA9251]
MKDSQMQRGQQWLEELLQLSAIPSTVVCQKQEDCFWMTIDESNLTPEQIAILVGPNGNVLDAIQYLCNTVLNIGHEPDEPIAYTVELNGYRIRRQEELRSMAQYAAEQARTTGVEVEIKSLSSAERRQIHNFLSECEDIETYSQGQDADRRLVVRLR